MKANTLLTILKSVIVTALLFASSSLFAEEKRVGDYVIHYNAFNSSFLQPNVARAYKIPRSGYTAVINISVHRDNPDHTSTALSANVQGKVTNLLSQKTDLGFREIKEDPAIYYLADFQFRNKEETTIEFTVKIPGEEKPITVKFDQKFYAN